MRNVKSRASANTSRTPSTAPPKNSRTNKTDLGILQNLWLSYVDGTSQETKLIDAFLVFLVVVGFLQFIYCIVVGSYPFNAFLAGFGANVGQFVLTVSLRMQTNPANQTQFKTISNERAFADYIFGSLILHFFCINFIN